MDFSELSAVFTRLEGISGRLEMTDVVAEFLRSVPESQLSTTLLFLRGRVFPEWGASELGVAEKLMFKALSDVSGASEDEINCVLRETGDMGLVAERIAERRQQTTLFSQKITVGKVHENLVKLSSLEGKGSQEKKLGYINELLSNASAEESKYLVRLILGQLRLGVGEGTVRDAIAKAFGVRAELVERGFNLGLDYGEVAKVAKKSGDAGLKEISMKLGQPLKVMLAQKIGGLKEALDELGEAEFEVKYDGARVQIHKDGEKIKLFTRRLEDITTQFPEVASNAKSNIMADSCIVEGEIVAINNDAGRRPLAFQNLSKRIKRKYRIEEMVKDIPVEVNLFDLVYLNGETKVDLPFRERRNLLSGIVKTSESFRLAGSLVTKDLNAAEEFYKKALDMGHEGVMAKVLDAPYQPGSRVGYMYKIKPIMETLDLVLTGATWGEGRRASWLGSYLLSIYDSETGGLLAIGRMATGLTDQQLQEMTELLKPTIISEDGKEVELKPTTVVEVAYEEIQKSPTYSSGYALRFPRLVRVREDKGVEEADNLRRVEELMKSSGNG